MTRSRKVNRPAVLLAILIALPSWEVHAINISVDLGSPGSIWTEQTFSFSGLNGTALNGNSISLDVMFSNEEFIRVFSTTAVTFDVLLRLQSDANGLVGFARGTAYLLDQNDTALHTAQVLGSSSSDAGSLNLGLFPVLSGELSQPFDFYGIHYDLVLPSYSAAITEGELMLVSQDPVGPFGVGPYLPVDNLPDRGGTLLLLCLGLTGLVGLKQTLLSEPSLAGGGRDAPPGRPCL